MPVMTYRFYAPSYMKGLPFRTIFFCFHFVNMAVQSISLGSSRILVEVKGEEISYGKMVISSRALVNEKTENGNYNGTSTSYRACIFRTWYGYFVYG